MRWAAAGALLAGITGALLAPARTFDGIDDLFPHQDKVAHGALFAALGWTVRWAWAAAPDRDRHRAAVLAALALHAATLELLQPRLAGAGRSFEPLDLLCNLLGVVAGWSLFGAATAAGRVREHRVRRAGARGGGEGGGVARRQGGRWR